MEALAILFAPVVGLIGLLLLRSAMRINAILDQLTRQVKLLEEIRLQTQQTRQACELLAQVYLEAKDGRR